MSVSKTILAVIITLTCLAMIFTQGFKLAVYSGEIWSFVATVIFAIFFKESYDKRFKKEGE